MYGVFAEERDGVGGEALFGQAHQVADGPEDAAMGDDERGAGPGQHTRHRGGDTVAQCQKRFRALGRKPPLHPFGEPGLQRFALHAAEHHLAQIGLEADRQLQKLVHDGGGFTRAQHRGGDDADDSLVGQSLAGQGCLIAASGVEQNIERALGKPGGVIIGLAMAQEPERDGG